MLIPNTKNNKKQPCSNTNVTIVTIIVDSIGNTTTGRL